MCGIFTNKHVYISDGDDPSNYETCIQNIMSEYKSKKLILEEQSPVNTEENYRYAFRVYESMLLGKHFISLDEKEENLNNWSNSFTKIFLYCEKL